LPATTRSKWASSDASLLAGLVLDQALLVAVERDDADRLRCRNSKANCRKTVHRRRLFVTSDRP